jgi:hypothetical protein
MGGRVKPGHDGEGKSRVMTALVEANAWLARSPSMPLLDSDALLRVHYNERARTLRATFRENRRTYDYFDVSTDEYKALISADSRGAWFNAHIRDCHSFREVI